MLSNAIRSTQATCHMKRDTPLQQHLVHKNDNKKNSAQEKLEKSLSQAKGTCTLTIISMKSHTSYSARTCQEFLSNTGDHPNNSCKKWRTHCVCLSHYLLTFKVCTLSCLSLINFPVKNLGCFHWGKLAVPELTPLPRQFLRLLEFGAQNFTYAVVFFLLLSLPMLWDCNCHLIQKTGPTTLRLKRG